jgi:N-acetylglucosamine-6-phosphate deacetylase
MPSVLLKNATVITPDGRGEIRSVLVTKGVIAAVGEPAETPENEIDLTGTTLFPGFIDIHDHGAVGVDVNTADAEGLSEVGKYLAKNGVTAWLPTLVPDSDDNYRRVIAEIDRLMKIQAGRPVAQAVGVHYEGVFSNETMCGALRTEYFKRFTGIEVDALPRLRSGVHMTTVAPEVDGGIELIRALIGRGWVVAIGHTNASPELLELAFEAGARHLTHFFNAMSGIHHREIGVAGWGLAKEDVTFDIIADGIHVHPSMLGLACRAKTPEKVTLISDSIAPAGLGNGEFELWDTTVKIENGTTRNERGTIAGSVITSLDAVRRIHDLGFPLQDIAKMASANPAKLLGIDGGRGAIASGKRADLVALDGSGAVRLVMIGGDFAEI